MKKIYSLVALVLVGFVANAQCPDLFISEVAEGSSSNKYYEIFNGTGADVDLSDYAFPSVGNAPTDSGKYEFWNKFDSAAVIKSDSVFVIAHPNADSIILSKADMVSYMFLSNGDDGFALVKGGTWNDLDNDMNIDAGEMTEFTVLDWYGDWNGDPGAGWDVAGVAEATKDHTLKRRAGFSGNNDWAASAGADSASSEWDVLPKDDWSQLGSHSADCAMVPNSVFGITKEALSVYPNPATNNLTVIGSERWNSYEIYSTLGSKVSEGTLKNNNLSVSNLIGGTYLIKLQADERVGMARFVINR
ncbi:MAG: hypothetical protein COA58_07645 [Bacteroidetes bacterium]|nr:MAG: hypothetical protein COA58_07645 [Bacteroidota bacterium]